MPNLSAIGRIAVLLAVAAPLGACQTLGSAGLVTSSVTAEITPEAASSIAGDMVGRLSEKVGPGSNTIQLRSDGSAFGQALEASLRGQGYAVVTDQKTDGANTVPLAYVIDSYEEGVLARLSTPSLDLTRIYKVTATGAAPASPLSVTQRDAGRS